MCGADNPGAEASCPDCGYYFSEAELAGAPPPAAEPAPAVWLEERYELGEVIGERHGVTRFRALDHGSGTPVPDFSIEVDNLDEVYQRALAAGSVIEYGPTREPWGVRRFYVRDPFGRLLNILAHDG